jgi:membrane-associated phospholipid phosphatase
MSLGREKLLTAIVLQTLIGAAFAAAQRWNGAVANPPPPWLVSGVDGRIPLVPASVWLYASWYVAPIVIVFADRATFRRAALAVLLGFLICAIGWVAVPATMPRPQLDGESGASIAMLQTVYRMDPPSNLFPSFHATLAAIVARVAAVAPGPLGLVVRGWMVAICVSCVATKQHYLLDVLAGALVGLGSWGGAVRLTNYLGRGRAPRAARDHQIAPPIASASVTSNATSVESGISAS